MVAAVGRDLFEGETAGEGLAGDPQINVAPHSDVGASVESECRNGLPGGVDLDFERNSSGEFDAWDVGGDRAGDGRSKAVAVDEQLCVAVDGDELTIERAKAKVRIFDGDIDDPTGEVDREVAAQGLAGNRQDDVVATEALGTGCHGKALGRAVDGERASDRLGKGADLDAEDTGDLDRWDTYESNCTTCVDSESVRGDQQGQVGVGNFEADGVARASLDFDRNTGASDEEFVDIVGAARYAVGPIAVEFDEEGTAELDGGSCQGEGQVSANAEAASRNRHGCCGSAGANDDIEVDGGGVEACSKISGDVDAAR